MKHGVNGVQREFEEPDICPHCHVANRPVFLSAFMDNEAKIIAVWRCANKDCDRLIFALGSWNGQAYPLSGFVSGSPKSPKWAEVILKLKSPEVGEDGAPKPSKFISIYEQSLKAENSGLTEIAGMGYRKAIEHLIKDFAIQSNPDKKKDIQSKWLKDVITTYFTGDPQLQQIMERATWLGNDQIHYLKLFEEYDVSDLKQLISLIVANLDRDFQTEHFINTISKRKPTNTTD